ncbi:MAG: hypothetical protein Q8N51_03550, partial [Gammaproteobacteria bacterium]|nr:hypothetical protein [Gammaproteobacteria bacterium]
MAVQYRDELFFCHARASSVRRIWREPSGALRVCQSGQHKPMSGIITAGSSIYTGDLVPATTYRYRVCFFDEKYRLSSPGVCDIFSLTDPAYVVTTGAGKTAIDLLISDNADLMYNTVGMVLFRAAQGTNDYYAVTVRPLTRPDGEYVRFYNSGAFVTITDVSSEALLVTGTPMPLDGQNDRPPIASVLGVHGNRLFCNDRTYGAVTARHETPWVYNLTDTDSLTRLWMSNIDAPTQFNAASDPDDQSLGAPINIGTDSGDPITALSSLGQGLGVWTAGGFYLVSGSGPAEWAVARMNDGGCSNQHTMVAIDNRHYWLGQDGVYTMTEGFAPALLSLPV